MRASNGLGSSKSTFVIGKSRSVDEWSVTCPYSVLLRSMTRLNPQHRKRSRAMDLQGHLLFWLLLLLGFTVIQFFKDGNVQGFWLVFRQNFKRIPAMLVAAYGFTGLIIPLLRNNNNYLGFFLGSLLLFYLSSAFDRIVNVYGYEPLFRKEAFVQESLFEIFSDTGYLFTGYLPPLLIAAVALALTCLLIERNRAETQHLKLERDKNKAELNVLKAQIHPHFLFNTLNNLYALTVQKSDSAPKMVEALSAMLDYILYQCNDRLVPLSKEIELVQNYIALERLRYGDEIDITFDIDTERALEPDPKIAPFLFLSLVENAFKHGVSGQVDGLRIQILLQLEWQELGFQVKNTKSKDKQQDATQYTEGIGIKNVEQQLQLVYQDADFIHEDQGNWYLAELRINTDSAYA
ncbi:MAG: histidine kinase [Flavobacteriaceae bacterium]|nr:histidine kinase [Flavobacteriaceae bacterium]